MNSQDRFIKLVQEKKKLMEQFLNLTEEQQVAISNKNYDSIFNLINEKQSIIEKVNLLDLELEELPADLQDKMKTVLAETKEVIGKALAIDEENIKKLQENKNEIAAKLKKARKNRKTHSHYRGKNVAIEGVLLDKRK